MALYPIKVLKDTEGKSFFPFTTTDSVLVNESSDTLQAILNDMYTKAQVDQKIANLGTVLSFRGVVETIDQLPTTGMQPGWVYVVRNYPQAEGGTTHSVIWDGTQWEDLGESIDLDLYYTKEETDTKISTSISTNNTAERQTTNAAIASSLNTAKNYTDTLEGKFNTHKDKKATDEVHGMRVNAEGKFEYWDGDEWVEVTGGGATTAVIPLPITNFQAEIVGDSAKLTYSIPDDVHFYGLLIRGKEGGVPIDVNDGSIILNSNIGGGSTIPVEVTDTNLTPGTRKYYRAFPYNYAMEHQMDTGQQVSTIIKLEQTAPAAPTLANSTDTSIVLTSVAGLEYRMGSGEWQTSNAFLGLDPVTEYTFYARKRATEVSHASPASTGAVFATAKPAQEAPAAPELQEVTSTSITLVAVPNVEYRMGSGAWQESPGFGSLNPGTNYTFYARMKETESMGVSPSSPGAVFRTDKLTQEAPSAPELSNRTDTSIVLKLVSGNEYKMDEGDWQSSNAFLGLEPVTEYTFYARKRETSSHYASASSTGISFTTMKPIPATPNTPTIQSSDQTSITLTPQTGCEYRRDNEPWQESNVFTDLTPGSNYTFYARVAETETHEASASSFGITTTTAKFTQEAPPAPEIPAVYGSAAIVAGIEGTEVSMNGALFFDSPKTFTGLDPLTNYEAYARMAETPTHYASPVSERKKFITGEEDFSITYDDADDVTHHEVFEDGPELIAFINDNKSTFRNEVKVVAAYFDEPWSAYELFSGMHGSVTSLDLSMFNTNKCTSMRNMFYNLRYVTELDVSNFDTSNVISMYGMFWGCHALTELDVSNFDTSNVTSMYGMFQDCSALTELDVSNFDTSNVTTMERMFATYASNFNMQLRELDVSNFDTSNVTNMSRMFDGCHALTEIDVSNFDTSKVTDMSYMLGTSNAGRTMKCLRMAQN